ncbi:hypothetical protein WN48_09289 [Eufriesea mexicana]|uniref:Uncharacterized protein n=1 Tax=Eufriesea mexicana TaxID=516756 RepID=A0A310S7C9_9HYME|nr:hypothetical protein WN48_09289 [Eufriesea mexicana]
MVDQRERNLWVWKNDRGGDGTHGAVKLSVLEFTGRHDHLDKWNIISWIVKHVLVRCYCIYLEM